MLMHDLIPFDARHNGSLMNWFDDFERSFWGPGARELAAFRTDIQDMGDHYQLKADLPGFQKEDLALEIQNDVLTIKAERRENCDQKDKDGNYVCRERRYGSFQRSFDVSGIQKDGIAAAYDNGVLTLTLPKEKEDVPAARQIEIK